MVCSVVVPTTGSPPSPHLTTTHLSINNTDSVKESFDKMYQGDLRNKMLKFPECPENQQQEIITQEENTIFDILAAFCKYT